MAWDWLKALRRKGKAGPQDLHYRPRVEEFEVRIMPVIGNQFELPALAPGAITSVLGTNMNLDGVVQTRSPSENP